MMLHVSFITSGHCMLGSRFIPVCSVIAVMMARAVLFIINITVLPVHDRVMIV